MTDYVLDIETTTDHKTIRLMGLLNCVTGQYRYYYDPHDAVSYLITSLREGDRLITWNGTRFDLNILSKYQGLDLSEELHKRGVQHIDAMLLAKLYRPDVPGGHSLDNWIKTTQKGVIATHKHAVPNPEWYNTCSVSELQTYNEADVRETYNVFCEIESSIGWDWAHPLRVEQEVAWLTNKQVERGVRFDTLKASDTVQKFEQEMDLLEKDIEGKIPEQDIPKSKLHHPPVKQFKQDGSPNANIIKYCHKYGYSIQLSWGRYYANNGMLIIKLPLESPLVTKDKISLGQTSRIKQYLLDIGWKPTEYNLKVDPDTGKKIRTSPLLTNKTTKEPCPNLKKLGIDWVEDLSSWYTLRSRRNLLLSPKGTGLILTANKDRGTLRSDADTLGTPTSRYRHKGIVNIPRVSTPYGEDIRSLFKPRVGYYMVGWDASGLEAAIEAHYVFPYDPEYSKMLISGDSDLGTDIHTKNFKELGLASRDIAKNLKYGITYGAQPPRVADIINASRGTAERIFDEFWATNLGLSELKKDLTDQWKRSGKKHLIGIDGRRISTRSEHSLLNSYFQSGGAILMKHAMLIAEALVAKNLPADTAYGLIRYHDEEQWECRAEWTEELGRIGVQSIEMAAKYLKLNVPVTGAYKIGNNWADTH